ncbi:MAG: hypothetical protein WC375_08700 [Methanomassiliicoccales archaeon]|jgi:hypothetical protein
MQTVNHKARNDLTEYQKNYRLYSPFLMDCYTGLQPYSLASLSVSLFCRILGNKWYAKSHEKDKLSENKRIYSNVYLSMDTLLQYDDPVGYVLSTEKERRYNSNNLAERIKKLCDGNVFYCWIYRQPFSRIFVMEREFASWKYYNANGCVTPKTVRKIVNSAKGMIETMEKIEKSRGRSVNHQDEGEIESSFGYFVNSIMGKMNNSVMACLPLWTGQGSVFVYLDELKEILKGMGDFEGLVESNDFRRRLPPSLRDKLHDAETKEANYMADRRKHMQSIESEIVPSNQNLTRNRKSRQSKKHVTATTTTDRIMPELEEFPGVDPFDNCNDFITLYQTVVRHFKDQAVFYEYDIERAEAMRIMDMLKDAKRSGNRHYLVYWFRYFVDNKLKGNHAMKLDKTSLSSLRSTFEEYNSKYTDS